MCILHLSTAVLTSCGLREHPGICSYTARKLTSSFASMASSSSSKRQMKLSQTNQVVQPWIFERQEEGEWGRPSAATGWTTDPYCNLLILLGRDSESIYVCLHWQIQGIAEPIEARLRNLAVLWEVVQENSSNSCTFYICLRQGGLSCSLLEMWWSLQNLYGIRPHPGHVEKRLWEY